VELAVAKVEAVEAVAAADLEVGAVGDPTAPEVTDSTLRDKMKGGLVCRIEFIYGFSMTWSKVRTKY